MKTTGLFTVSKYSIKVNELNKPIYLIPFGDIHKDSPLHSKDRWNEFLEWAEGKGERAYFLGMGDYLDFMSSSERQTFKSGNFHESTTATLEEMADKHVDALYHDIKFMKGRLIGLIEGNHYFHYASGITSTQKLCDRLKCKYLGCLTFSRLHFVYRHQTTTLDLYAHHGKGAARLLGGSLNRVQQMAESVEADIYLMGHDHKGPIAFNPRLRLSESGGNMAVVERKQFFGRTGSFLRGHVPGEVSYVSDGCMNPANIGVTKIDIVPMRKHAETFKVEMHASI